jgi:hypothetical protein
MEQDNAPDLGGKIALVTGASRGIGCAIESAGGLSAGSRRPLSPAKVPLISVAILVVRPVSHV